MSKDGVELDGVTRADRVRSTDPSEAVDAAPAVEGVNALDPRDAEIAAALATGRLDSSGAQARLIDEVVRAQLPPSATDAEIDALRSEVAAMVADDPGLAALLRP